MLKNLRIGWRQFVADPGYTAVVVGGLSVSIAACFLVAQVVFNQVLPDPGIPQPAQVATLEARIVHVGAGDLWSQQAPYVLAGTLRDGGAPITAVARTLDGNSFVMRAGGRSARLALEFGDPDLVDIFGLESSAGDLRAALKRPDAIALTEASARKLFPDGDAMGKPVMVHGHALTVMAVVPARPRLFDTPADAYASIDSPACPAVGEMRTDWGWTTGNVYARVAPGFKAADVGAAAQRLYEKTPDWKKEVANSPSGHPDDSYRAIALTHAYLDGAEGRGRTVLLLSMAGGAALMLALAVANYVNLTSVRTLARSREIAVRKTLGANPWHLTLQFVLESTLTSALAAAIGLLLAWWLAPTTGEFLNLHLVDGLFSPGRLAALWAATLVLGVCTGLYPARIALGVNCIAALAGRSHDEGAAGRGARRAMTALQFAVALVIAGGAGSMLWQNHFVGSLESGIRTKGLLAVDVPNQFFGKADAADIALRQALSHEPGVEAIAWSMDVPGRNSDKTFQRVGRGAGMPALDANFMTVDRPFFDVYGVHILAGQPRAPAPPASAASGVVQEGLVVLDATTARTLGFASPQAAVDQVIYHGGELNQSVGTAPLRVVAVASDVRLEDAREAPMPHIFAISNKPQAVLTLQGPRMAQLQQAVAHAWPRLFPEDAVDTTTVEDAVAQPYVRQHRLAQVAAATTLIALLLSAFGVYALAAYTVRRSAREIVIRKLHGASRGRIARLVAREFVPLLAAAAVIGLPLAGWIGHAWLQNFVERSPSILWVLPVTLLALVATTVLAALRHARIAMAMRPAVALRA